MIADLVDAVVVRPVRASPGRRGHRLEAPWACTGCGSCQGFRRRGFRPKPRKVTSASGKVAFRSQQLGSGASERRFAPGGRAVGPATPPAPHRGPLRAGCVAGREAYAKASRLRAELAGPSVSARSVRVNRDVIAMAP